jgi:hypothetical protein
LNISDEKERPDGCSEMHIHHCDHHRDHRAFLAELAAKPGVEGLEKTPPS